MEPMGKVLAISPKSAPVAGSVSLSVRFFTTAYQCKPKPDQDHEMEAEGLYIPCPASSARMHPA